MRSHHESRLARLETQQQAQQGMPPLYVLRDEEKLPWNAPEHCLVIRLASKLSEEEWARQAQQAQRLTPEETWAQWNRKRSVEREAPPPHRQQP